MEVIVRHHPFKPSRRSSQTEETISGISEEYSRPATSRRRATRASVVSFNSQSSHNQPSSADLGSPKEFLRSPGKKGDVLQRLDLSDVIFVLKPMLLSLKVLGLWPREANTFFKRLNPQSAFIFFYIHLYTAHNLINWIYTFHRDLGLYAFLNNASLLVRTGATAVTLDLFFSQFEKTLESLTDIDNFPPLFSKCNLRSLRMYIVLLVIVSWLYLFCQLGFSIWSVAVMDIQQFMDWYFYGIRVTSTDTTFMRFFMASIWVSYVLVTLSAEIFIKTFYIASCLLLGRCARAYRSTVQDGDNKQVITGADLHAINLNYTHLCDLVIEIDKNFTIEAFVWLSTIFLNLCCKLGLVIIGSDPNQSSGAFMDVINYFLILITLLLVAADVSHQIHLLLPVAHRLASKADLTDLGVLYQAKLMVAKMSHPGAKLTGWGCFVLDRPFVLTVIGTIVTYSVVLMQTSRSMKERKAVAEAIAALVATPGLGPGLDLIGNQTYLFNETSFNGTL